jgi:hypothetical protein
MRACAAIYLLTVLCALLAQPTLQATTISKLTGSHNVSLQRDVGPVFAVFLLATAHAALGEFLQATLVGNTRTTDFRVENAVPEGQDEDAPGGGGEVAVPLLPLQDPPTADYEPQRSAAAARLARRIEACTKTLASVALQAGALNMSRF